MCGIAGVFAYGVSAPPVERNTLSRMNDAMIARGPDGEGTWLGPEDRIGFGHRRLSIIDLSDSGAQPMIFEEGRLGITYNGEIYNFRELRTELEAQGRRFRSESDTEVLLHLYDRDGTSMVDRLRGMFAFAIYDRDKQGIFLARDGFGIKPLYYANDGQTLRFASQVKALLAGGGIDTTPSAPGLAGVYVWGSVPEPWTLFDKIRSLPAGSTMWVGRDGTRGPIRYFDVTEELEQAAADPIPWSPSALREALLDTLKHHLISDVPVGAFLSAGLDSATIIALTSELQPDALRSVTLAFDEYNGTEFDEAALAENIARHYETSHQTQRVKGANFHEEYQRLCTAMDQPTIDGVNTYFVSKVTADTGLKVAMSGLGGDEFFGGYPAFTEIPRIVGALGKIPGIRFAGRAFRKIAGPAIGTAMSPKYAGVFEYGSTYPDAYLLRRAIFMPWELPKLMDTTMARDGWAELEETTRLRHQVDRLDTSRTKISALESTWYMRNQLLRDSDWAGMAHSLEIRVPLVDTIFFRKIAPMLVSHAPPGKRDMASSPTKPLPAEVISRPKTGFAVPLPAWLMKDNPDALKQGYRGWLRKVVEDCYA